MDAKSLQKNDFGVFWILSIVADLRKLRPGTVVLKESPPCRFFEPIATSFDSEVQFSAEMIRISEQYNLAFRFHSTSQVDDIVTERHESSRIVNKTSLAGRDPAPKNPTVSDRNLQRSD